MSNTSFSKLAKNSLYLYVRSIIVMIIGLYTSKLVLSNLGVVDYGIYNVVGSFVMMFAFLDGALQSACVRFLNYEKGKGDKEQVQLVNNTIITIIYSVAFLIFIAVEILGLFLLKTKLDIPTSRLSAAEVVFHLSAVTLIFNTISIPYNSLILANERMGAYAYFDILLSILKLFIVIVLPFASCDSLIIYTSLLLLVQVLYRVGTMLYCKRNFPESKYKFQINKQVAKDFSSFSGWTILNSISSILVFQGLSVLFNIYFGVLTNAAIGIASQVRSVSLRLTQSIGMSLTPQLTQNYACHNESIVKIIYFTGSKILFCAFSVIALLLMTNTEYILQLWLGTPPLYSCFFVRILLANCIAGFIAGLSTTIVNANGSIFKFQVGNALLSYLSLIVVYVYLKLGCSLYIPYIIITVATILQSFFSIGVACMQNNYSFMDFSIPMLKILLALVFVYCLGYWTNHFVNDFYNFIIQSIFLGTLITSLFYFFGFDKDERSLLLGYCKKVMKGHKIK